jgi:energy-coupling factor transporter ATP-binding protein EcfA2
MGKFLMSLRQAKFDDHWRRVYSKTYPTRFTSVSVEHLYCLADGTIDFAGGINAIVGGNGVGKSTLVASIAQLLASDPNAVEVEYTQRLGGSTIRGTAFSGGTELHLSVQDSDAVRRTRTGDEFNGEHRWLEPSVLANRCLAQIHADQNFDDLLESVTPFQLGLEELQIASFLVGKNYAAIDIYEISDYGTLDPFPYFHVSSAGASYGSEGMGRGELSLLLTYWMLRSMPPKSVLILEEPETHVSPRSQDALMNVVAKFSAEMAIWVIVTTHSPAIIRRIPRAHLKLLVRGEGPATCTANATKLDIGLLLGGGVAFNGVILVEDAGAKRFVHSLIEKLDPEMLRQFEITVAESSSHITGVLKSMPSTSSWLTLFGAYDGDMRAQITGAGLKRPFGFLPGDVAPEELLIALANTMVNFAQLLAAELGETAERITMALNHVAGIDHHDFFGQLAAFLNLEVSATQRGFVRIWLQDESNRIAAEAFIEAIRKAAR